MAQETNINNNETDIKENINETKNDNGQGEQESASSNKIGVVTWIILGLIIVSGSGGGYGLAQIFASPEQDLPQQPVQVAIQDPMKEFLSKEAEKKSWEFELEPVIANLDEPGVTRYIRATLILKFNSELDEMKYSQVLENRKTELVDWLYQYMAGLSLEEVHGSRNIERFKLEVCHNFNNILFTQSKPFLEKIMTKEFQIQ